MDPIDKNKVLLIINPIAGRLNTKASRYQVAKIFRQRGYKVDLQITEAKGHATQIVLDKAKNNDMVVCCGGDGTLNEVISGIMQLDVKLPVGYVPAGSTNDFATSLNIPNKMEDAVEGILSGRTRILDVGCFNNRRYFNYIASFGAFTGTSYSTPQSNKNIIGHLAYVLEGVKDIPNIHPYRVRVKANGEIYEDDYIFVAVSNSTSIGGIVKLDTEVVDLNDGLIELILVKNPKTPMDISKIIVALTKKDYNNEMIAFIKTSEVQFKMKEPVSWTVDGEYEEGGREAVIQIIPNAITLLG
ncbi:MAG TPA: diacylglycerol kinase family lipid kinase [Clostridiales bacterium]|nr:diacylglycerol kinase family lipid kinase [Clostridiales bacterium]